LNRRLPDNTVGLPWPHLILPAFTWCFCGKSWDYVGFPPLHIVAKPGVHLRHNSCRFYYRFTRRRRRNDHAGRATVMPWNKLTLFSPPGASRWVPVVFKLLKLLTGDRRFNTVYPDSTRCLPASLRRGSGWPRCPHRSDTRDWKPGQCERGL